MIIEEIFIKNNLNCSHCRIAFFTETGTNVGMGHLVRSYTIFKECKKLSNDVIFFLDSDVAYDYKFSDINYFGWETLQIETLYDIIFIDSYIANIGQYNYLTSKCKKLVCIDDYDRLDYPKSTIINFAPDAKELFYKKQTNRHHFLLGTKYLPIREELQKVEKKSKKKHIFIMLGGEDIDNLSNRVLESLETIKIKKVIVINNKKAVNALQKYKNIKILYKPSNEILYENMASSMFAVTTASMTVYELSYLQIPSIIIAINKNQFVGINQFLKYKLAYFSVDIYNNNFRKDISKKAYYLLDNNINMDKIIDSDGVSRILKEVIDL